VAVGGGGGDVGGGGGGEVGGGALVGVGVAAGAWQDMMATTGNTTRINSAIQAYALFTDMVVVSSLFWVVHSLLT
jgi:hypothetical protein